jgi:iron complex transport system ATP-binding protein
MADCEAFIEQTVNTLSGGERLRVLLARLFASEPDVILADEPTAALDPYHQLHTMEILQQHAKNGGTVVVVLHDINLAARFCDRLIVIDSGEIAADDSVDNILASDILQNVYQIDLLIHEIDGQRIIVPINRR